jgi:hypothetical protein
MGTSAFIQLLQSDSDVILMLSAWLLSHIAIDGMFEKVVQLRS